MRGIEIPSLYLDVEVTDSEGEYLEVDGTDMRLNGETGTVEVTLMGSACSSEENIMLDVLRVRGIDCHSQLVAALDKSPLGELEYIADLLSRDEAFKYKVLKALAQEA